MDQLGGAVRPRATGLILDGIDAIEGSKIRGVGLRLALLHLVQTSKRIQMTDLIQQAETKPAARKRAIALEAASPEGLQGAAEVRRPVAIQLEQTFSS